MSPHSISPTSSPDRLVRKSPSPETLSPSHSSSPHISPTGTPLKSIVKRISRWAGKTETNCVLCGRMFMCGKEELSRNAGSRCWRCKERVEIFRRLAKEDKIRENGAESPKKASKWGTMMKKLGRSMENGEGDGAKKGKDIDKALVGESF